MALEYPDYEVAQILYSKQVRNRCKLTIMKVHRVMTLSSCFEYDCLNHDNNLITRYTEKQLKDYYVRSGTYNKTVRTLYVKSKV